MYLLRFSRSVHKLFFFSVIMALGATALFYAVGFYPVAANTHREVEQQQKQDNGIEKEKKVNDRKLVGEGRLMISSGGGIYVISADPNNQQNSYTIASPFFLNGNQTPSVSSQTGKIAYLSNRRSENVYLNLVWAMDADGSNPHQVTPPTGLMPGNQDSAPVISPDGSQIAFISRRFGSQPNFPPTPEDPNGAQKDSEVFVVNFDGSGLHQVTPSEQADNSGITHANAVVWGDNGTLYVSGRRVITNMAGARVNQTGIFTFGAGGGAQGTLVKPLPNLSDPVTLDVSGLTILFVFDNKLYVGSGNSYNIIQPETAGMPRWGEVGDVRFSPDGSRIVYSSDEQGGSIKTIGIDGTSPIVVRANMGHIATKWWMPGPMPTPSRLEMSPSQVFLPNDGSFQQMVPTLYDTNNQVIFRAATFDFLCDATHPCYNGVDGRLFNFYQDGQLQVQNVGETRTGAGNFCGTSGGITGCSVVSIGIPNFAEIRGSVPSTNTNGSGGPGVFTIRRQSNLANNAFNVDFTMGGTAVRDVDYVLKNVAGNSITFQGGQVTQDIQLTPIRAAGNKTVTMSITAPSGSSYFTLPGRDIAGVNIVDNGMTSAALSLSSITPASGGNGGVVVSTLNGNNMMTGATVKLTRTGQPDIPGANVNVAAGGRSLTTVFDLNGRSVGQWNVVVTNTNATSAQINNGFNIETNSEARLSVQISGASTIRASHTRSRYDVVYTNHGNTDVFGVLLYVTGVAANECVGQDDSDCTFLETPLANIPDIPGQTPFPAWVRQIPNIVPTDLPNVSGPGLRHVGAIPVLIPRIPAHGTGTFRFSMRFTVIGENALQRINAAILPPFATAVTVPNASKPTVAMSPEVSDAAVICFNAAFQAAVSCALGLVPGGDCVRAGVAGIQNVAGVIGNISLNGTSAVNHFSGAQLGAAAVSLMACIKDLTPIGKALDILSCLAVLYDACETCLGAGACNPFSIFFVQSADPNEKTGIRRLTAENYVTRGNLLYGISFENQPSATAPAQDVVVTDQIDTSTLDITTLELGQVSFGDTIIAVPPGLKSYATQVDLRPSKDLLVNVSGSLNQQSGLLTWTFHSLDPFTRQTPTNALAGFLPPNILGTEGAGKVLFTISPKSSVTFGTQIRNKARIVFDLNAPIDTNEWLNTIDDSLPTSSVTSLGATQNTLTFPVSWTGTDTGSGIADYSVFVSDNGGPFTLWQNRTIARTASFTGQIGHLYGFYSVAQDNAPNLELAPLTPDTTTLVLGPTAAGVTVSGRVLTSAEGRGLRNAMVTLTDQSGHIRTALTGRVGYYHFEDVEAGQNYVVAVRSRRLSFLPQIIQVNDNLFDVDFSPQY